MRALFAAAAVTLLAAGCNNDCQNLANNICECAATQTDQSNCQAAAALANSANALTSDDLANCHQWLQTCDCRILASGSFQAKVACGLARPNPGDRFLSPAGQ